LRNAAGRLVGAIYGYRSLRPGNARRGIRYLEAHTIEMLANAVSEGIARLEREAEVDRRRVLMEQTFATAAGHDCRRITSDNRDVTMLFADLRGSTQLTAALESEEAFELLGQVMDCLTAAVMDHDGLVIDYYGDGLAAMWNAPADQAEHPELACRAALRMLETLPDVAADWAEVLTSQLRMAIGVHTGCVMVGNAGSRRRTRYGPRGKHVHLASRVEAAAKHLQLPLLVTRQTVERLSNRLAAHRTCRARVHGMEQPVDLFCVASASLDARVSRAWSIYDKALGLFEQGDLPEAAAMLKTIDPMLSDIPLQFLAQHIERQLGRKRQRRRSDADGHDDGAVISLGK
jgi:adenylate cyclase